MHVNLAYILLQRYTHTHTHTHTYTHTAGKGLQLLSLREALLTAEHAWQQGTTKRKHQLQVLVCV